MMLQWTANSRGGVLADRRIQCPVVDEGPKVSDDEINAFRILPETGRAYFLDFIHYSPANQRAHVVSRVRVHEDTLLSIKDRLTSDMVEVNDDITVFWVDPKMATVN